MTVNAFLPLDTATMRATTALVLAENAELPTADELNSLTLLYRGHLMLLIPAVEKAVLRLPQDGTVRRGVHAGVGEARTHLDLEGGLALPAQVAHAQRLARSVIRLLGHLENLGESTTEHRAARWHRTGADHNKENQVTEPTTTPFGLTRMRPFPSTAVLAPATVVLDPKTQTGRWLGPDELDVPELDRHKRSETSKETKTRTSLDGNPDEGGDQQGDSD